MTRAAPEYQRFFRFSLVGTLGTAVQLLAVALYSRLAPGHHLAATATGLELSLLHNFIWHEHYTWRDRNISCSRGSRLLRFHVAKGLISLAGNLFFVAVFVRVGVNLIVANLAAIGLCAGLNYATGNTWVFGAGQIRSVGEMRAIACTALPADPPPDPANTSA